MADYTRFPEAFRAAGIEFTEEAGWRDRGHGDIRNVNFIVLHHTAGGNDSGDIRVVRDGRTGLPGPLSQLVLKRNGQPHIVAAGICYHAPGSKPFRGVPTGSGNYYSIGIEGVSNGYNDWTDAQRTSYPRVVAALLKDMGLPSDAWIFHREYQPGEKIDPAGFDRDWMQRQIDAAYNGIAVETAIQAARKKFDWLGAKTIAEEELPCADGIGRYAHYENGSIYWHPATGARSVRKDVFEKWATFKWEQGEMGYPILDAGDLVAGGHFSKFQRGSLYYNPATKKVYQTKGAIFDRWGVLKWENGILGYPRSDEVDMPGRSGVIQAYDGGVILWSPETGAVEIVEKGIAEEYNRVGHNVLGYPISSAKVVAGGRGIKQKFQKGMVYQLNIKTSAGLPDIQGHALTGEILKIYEQIGAEDGRLGLPITDVYAKTDVTDRVDFEAGSIEHDKDDNDLYLVLSGKRVDIPLPPVEDSKPEPKPEPAPIPDKPDFTGRQVIDYSAAVPSASVVKSAGFVGAIRYVSDPRESWMKGKPLTRAEAEDYKANGLWIASNYQYSKGGNTTSDWTIPSDGPADAARGLEIHKAAGGPDTAPIFVSIDASPTRDMYDRLIKPYLRHWQNILGNDRLGVYANGRVIDWLVQDGIGKYYWQHNWSDNWVSPYDGKVNSHHPEACVHQIRIDKDTVDGVGVDINVILKSNWGQWQPN